MPKKKEEEIKPIVETKQVLLEESDYEDLLNNSDNVIVPENSNAETIFKDIASNMNKEELISMKTEYQNTTENFAGTRMEFLAIYGNVPLLQKFVKIHEVKRVSLNRKGRMEDIMILQERRAEMDRQKNKNLLSALGI